MKYIKNYNESLKEILKSKPDEDILSKIKILSTDEIIEQSFENNFKAGFKYILNNRRIELNDDKIFIIEKYGLGLHQDEEKPYETWFKEQLDNLEIFPSIINSNIIIYKKENDVLFNYYIKYNILYITYAKIWSVFENKYKLNYLFIKILTKYMIEKYLNLKDISKLKTEKWNSSLIEV